MTKLREHQLTIPREDAVRLAVTDSLERSYVSGARKVEDLKRADLADTLADFLADSDLSLADMLDHLQVDASLFRAAFRRFLKAYAAAERRPNDGNLAIAAIDRGEQLAKVLMINATEYHKGLAGIGLDALVELDAWRSEFGGDA